MKTQCTSGLDNIVMVKMDKTSCSPWKLFEKSCRKYGNNIMVVHSNRVITYKQMDLMINELSHLMHQISFCHGGIYLPNSIEFITSVLALNKIGKVVVPMSYMLKGESLLSRVLYADIDIVITDDKGFGEIKKIENSVSIRAVIIIKEDGCWEIYMSKRIEKCRITHKKTSDLFGIYLISRDNASILGTVFSNVAVVKSALKVARMMRYKKTDKILAVRAFTLEDPMVSDIFAPISCGALIVISGNFFHPSVILRTIEDFGVTSVCFVGTMLSMIMDYPNLDKYNIKSLKKLVFTAINTPAEILKIASQKFKEIKLYSIYGPRECPSRITAMYHEQVLINPGSIGKPIEGTDIKICREDMTEASLGECGVLYVIGDCIMKAYYKNDSLTRETLTSKGLKTRDLGYRDVNGFIYLTGRTDSVIIQGGYEIFPVEIEEILKRNPAVKKVYVQSKDDKKLGRKAVVFVTLHKGFGLEIQDLFGWLRANIEDKKLPKEMYIV